MREWALSSEIRLHLAAMVVYGTAVGLTVFGTLMSKTKIERSGHVLAILGLVVHSVALLLRWYGVEHGPYLSRYEVLSSNSLAAMAMFLLLVWRVPRLRSLSVLVYPAVLIVLGIGIYTGPEVQMLPPTFTGLWLVMHVCFYFVAFAAALISLGASLFHVFHETSFVRRFSPPPRELLDRESYRFAGLTFAFWGIGMLTGSIWAYYSWGRYWGWDPVETWSLITWLVYGIYLHLRRFFGLRGRSAALVLTLGFVLAIGSLFFTSLLTASLHAEYFR